MENIEQSRIVEGLKYKTLTNPRWGSPQILNVEILRVTAKTVTYKVGGYEPETDRISKYKPNFSLPAEALEADIENHNKRTAFKADVQFIKETNFENLSPEMVSEIVTLIKSKV